MRILVQYTKIKASTNYIYYFCLTQVNADENPEAEGESSFTQAPTSLAASAQVLKNINEYDETASNDKKPDNSIISENKENAEPQMPGESEVFRGRRVSHFDIPTKKV